ncbi:winged helix-turn-helix domain-containing protein [Enterobacter cancerogenus]|uniref:winged helix-turn-helix domain-containing protein n=1 Tax=Enterobacter cancerogenus TaxID=69218 RepID=UPI0019292E09|nr:winged helix-turn-helix domain-containing protein [Enterobacter cancerogenus]
MRKLIISDKVLFIPAENKLCSLGVRGPEVILNVPVCRFLVLLLENCNQVVHQELILREVWERHGQLVTLNTLYQNVSLLRKGLKKAGLLTTAVKTHPKVGFSFCGSVQIIEDEKIDASTSDIAKETLPKAPVDGKENLESILPANQNGEKQLSVVRSKKLNAYKRVHIFYLALISLAIIFLIAFIKLEKMMSNKFNAEHDIVAQVNRCPVYVDRGNRRVDFSRIIGYLGEQGVTCGDGEFIYLTKSIYRDELLLFTCAPMNDEELVCSTHSKLPPYLYPK